MQPYFLQRKDEQGYRQHAQLVNQFQESPSVLTAQQQLEQRATEMAKHGKSWLIDWWNDYAYMSYRDSVVLNVSYFLHFRDDPFRRQQSVRAASLIRGACLFKEQLVTQQLAPEMAGKDQPMCMQ